MGRMAGLLLLSLALAGCGARTLGAGPQGEDSGPNAPPPGHAPRDAGPTPPADAGPRDSGPSDAAGPGLVEDRFTYTDRLDVLWIVDQSPSMDEESAAVRDHLGRFATAVASSGRDLRVTLLASRDGDNGLCIPPPLGGPGCTEGERFDQVDVPVGSHNSLVRVQENIERIEATLRTRTPRAIVVVSDDESAMPADWFDRWLRERGTWYDYGAYAVTGLERSACPGVQNPGRVYQRLADMRGGRAVSICAPDWDRLVDELATDVATRPQRFPLAYEPADPVTVLAGEPLAELAPDAWRLDASGPAVVVLEPLRSGTPVVVRYRATGE